MVFREIAKLHAKSYRIIGGAAMCLRIVEIVEHVKMLFASRI